LVALLGTTAVGNAIGMPREEFGQRRGEQATGTPSRCPAPRQFVAILRLRVRKGRSDRLISVWHETCCRVPLGLQTNEIERIDIELRKARNFKDQLAMPNDISPAYARRFKEVLEDLDVRQDQGLTKQQVRRRRERFGRNRLREAKQRSFWLILLAQLKSVVILLMVVAAVLAFVFAHIPMLGRVRSAAALAQA
jgi:magnesium-transporting ATPase (P-type)